MENHLIVCGLGHVGYRLAELLHDLCEPFVVIARNIRPEWRDMIELRAARFVVGDARSEATLREAGIETARAILVVTSDDLVNMEIGVDAKRLNPRIAIIMRVLDPYLADRIGREMDVRDVLSPGLLTAPVFVAAAVGDFIVRAFNIDGCNIHIVRIAMTGETPGIGERVLEFCDRRDLFPLSVQRQQVTPHTLPDTHVYDPGVPMETPLREGDTLVVAAAGAAIERLHRGGYLPTPPATAPPKARSRLAQSLRRSQHPLRLAWIIWRRAPRILRRAAFLLLSIIGSSVFVFHQWLPGKPSWVDSFYFVVTILTTVGFGDFNLRNGAWWLKLYGAGMMLAGATMLTILYGVITDYIVTTRVDQALGRRKSNLSNHLVLIGLGDVGSRILEELQRIGQPVVAIEREADNDQFADLQEQVQVIIGDANRDHILMQASIDQARAVIVTTNNDLDSLRIAHQAEMLNPQIRSVIRIYDSNLASKIANSLGIDRAVNAAETAAATFAACAFEEHVEQGFVLDGRLLMLRWLLPDEVYRRGMVGATMGELHDEGNIVLLKRSGSGVFLRTNTTSFDDIVTRQDHLLALEEYYPDRRQCGSPQVGHG